MKSGGTAKANNDDVYLRRGMVLKPVSEETLAIVRRGRPLLGEVAKSQVTLRLDEDVVASFKSGGAGWQTRMNAALRKAAKLPAAK